MKRILHILSLLISITFTLTGCMTFAKKHNDPIDPYEGYNRAMFKFNMKFDKTIYRPVAQLYDDAVPPQYNAGIRNFFQNLDELPTVANDLLQADFIHAAGDTWRFALNTTLGIGGLVDMAKKMGLPAHSNDFGVTLAKWGVRKSEYVMIPFLGPSTFRDSLGFLVDYQSFMIYPHIKPGIRYSLHGLQLTQMRASLLPSDKLLYEAFDPYVFLRNAYLQHRDNEIRKALGEQQETDTWVEDNETATNPSTESIPSKKIETAKSKHIPLFIT